MSPNSGATTLGAIGRQPRRFDVQVNHQKDHREPRAFCECVTWPRARPRKGKAVISDRDVKICQLLRERGNQLIYQAGRLQVQMTADGSVREKKSSIPLPRCVSADKTFKKKPWETLNKLFKGDRVGQVGITFGRSKAEMAKCMLMFLGPSQLS